MGINRIPASVVQYTQYYPSGLPWESNSGDNPGLQHKKYNGKEFIEMNNYDTYDYGARGYYPAIGRFTTVDPLAERRPWMSPYVFCSDNPVNRIDMDGNIWTLSLLGTSKYLPKYPVKYDYPHLNVLATLNCDIFDVSGKPSTCKYTVNDAIR